MKLSAPIPSPGRFKLFAAGLFVAVLLVFVLAEFGPPSASSLLWENGNERGENAGALQGGRSSVPHVESICDTMKDSLERDVCYWDRFIKEWQRDGIYRQDYCNLVGNPFMQYVCLRGGPRPHMMTFVLPSNTSATPSKIPHAVEGCRMQDDHLRRFCIMEHVASLASSNLAEAKRICTTLGDSLSIGECTFYIAVGRAMNLGSGNMDKEITAVMELCDSIGDANWKGECYFLLADELALLRPVSRLSDIVEACRRSTEAFDYDYACYGHVALLLPRDEASAYCGLIDDKDHQSGCALDVGSAIANQNKGNITGGMEECWKLFPSLVENCISGVAYGSGALTTNLSQSNAVCREFPAEYVEICFHGAIRNVIPPYTNYSLSLEKCNEVPLELRGFCFGAIIIDLHQLSSQDPLSAQSACLELPDPFGEKCLENLQPERGR